MKWTLSKPAEAKTVRSRFVHHAVTVENPSSIDSLDRRTRQYRRWLSIRTAVFEDLGGEDRLSEVQKQLVSKFATMAIHLEATEAEALAGQEIDGDLFGRSAGHLRRLAETIGLNRVARDVTDLNSYIRSVETVA